MRVLLAEGMYTPSECYKILGLKPGASKQDIKKAYIKLAKEWHPDLFPNDIQKQKQAEEKFKAVNEAYSKLKDLADRPKDTGFQPYDTSTQTAHSSYRYTERNPNINSAQAEYLRAMDLVNEGRIQSAIKALNLAIQFDLEFLAAYQLRGHLREKLGRNKQAKSDFAKVAELKKNQQKQQKTQPDQKTTQETKVGSQKQQEAKKNASPSWQKILSFKGHRKAITGLISKQVIITTSFDGQIKFWQFGQREPFTQIKAYNGPIYQAVLTWDARQIITVGATNIIRFWDIKGAKPVRTLGNSFGGHLGEVYAAALAPNQQILVSAGTEKVIKGWELKMGRVLFEVQGGSQVIRTIAMSPVGDFFACCIEVEAIQLFQVKNGQKYQSFKVDSPVNSLQFINSKLLVSGDVNGNIHIRDLDGLDDSDTRDDSGTIVQTLAKHRNQITDLAYSTTHNLLASSSLDQSVKLWNLKTGELITSLEHQDEVLVVAIESNGQRIVSGTRDGKICFWEYKK